MYYTQGLYPLIKKQCLAKNTFDFTVYCPDIAQKAQAGQFVHLKANGYFLRRPISICEIDREAKTLRLVFEVRGDGTKALSEIKENENVDMIAPLGNGFSVDKSKKAVCIGGGIGAPPMLETVKSFSDSSTAILGFKTAKAVILNEDFSRAVNTVVCTDDGSFGEKGFVTTALENYLKENSADIICACGPAPMLKAVAKIAREHQIPCEISLEERMACGVGACLGCACKVIQNGEEKLRHVCKNGPVFNSEEVVL